ncbi:MAG: class I SAM-dependent methyltransferase [Candidatus Helarchaeota archaeon]
MKTPTEIDQDIKAKFESNIYSIETVTGKLTNDKSYFNNLLHFKIALLKKYCRDKVVLDLCCGTGEILFEISNLIKKGYGLDFSEKFIEKANQSKALLKKTNLNFIIGNARNVQFPDRTFDLIFSYSSLYLIPKVAEVINEISRLLQEGGYTILDLGNYYSLNTIVCLTHPTLPKPSHLKLSQIKAIFKKLNLKIVTSFAFQILPFWGSNPKWLKPLLHPLWKSLLEKKIGSRMLDELICEIPLVKRFAFRHIYICQKTNDFKK